MLYKLQSVRRGPLDAQRGKMNHTSYPWRYGAFTVSTTPPDTWAMGRYNDTAIKLENVVKKDQTQKIGQPADESKDLSVVTWRCEALEEALSTVRELTALPRGAGRYFNPRELLLSKEEAEALLFQFREALRNGKYFEMILEFLGDQRPVTIRFIAHGTAAHALFTLDVDKKPSHIHAVIAFLPRRSLDDDMLAIEHIKRFVCLKDISDRAFVRASSDTEPTVAIFYADIGSANFSPLFSTIRIMTAAFFSGFGQTT
jgi:hypothetical protein